MKWKISFILLFCLLLGIFLGVDHLQDGFSVQEIQIYSSKEESEPLSSEIQASLNQKFKYLGKGCQFYVFESQDGRFVLKFFKQKHLRPIFGKSPRRCAKVQALCQSCEIAARELPEETGVLYVHLARTKDPLLVSLTDKLGLRHVVDLRLTQCVLQKKAESAPAVFERLLNEKREEELREKIAQLLQLTASRCLAHVADQDKAFVQNVGFLQERALLIDIGQLCQDPDLNSQQEIKKRLEALISWAHDHQPRLLPFLKEGDYFASHKK